MDASAELNLENPAYQKAVDLYVWQTYRMDRRHGDVTSNFFLGQKNPIVRAKIIAKEAGILAGMQEAQWFMKKLKIKILKSKMDGAMLKKGDEIMVIEGKAHCLLKVERTLLNLLQRMSGIATATDRLVKKLPKTIQLLATRKTFWGELDKRAVAVGGGGTHRLNLSDAILIKDNHISLTDDWLKSLKQAIKKAKKVRFIEIELENLKQVSELAGFCRKNKYPKNFVVMLDNFTPADVQKAIGLLKGLNIFIEVSGGINEKNIRRYAIKGVAAISSGAITNGARALDMSMTIN